MAKNKSQKSEAGKKTKSSTSSGKGASKTTVQAITMRNAPKKGTVTAKLKAKPQATKAEKKAFRETQREALDEMLGKLVLTLKYNDGPTFSPVVPPKADYSVKTVKKDDQDVTKKLKAIVMAVKKAKATGKKPEVVPLIKANPTCPAVGCSRNFLTMAHGKSCQDHCRTHLDQPDFGKDAERTARAYKINDSIKKNKAAAAAKKDEESADDDANSSSSDDDYDSDDSSA